MFALDNDFAAEMPEAPAPKITTLVFIRLDSIEINAVNNRNRCIVFIIKTDRE